MRLLYISAEKPKSARERYICVAAIDIVISEGVRNIWIAERNRILKTMCSATEIDKDVRDQMGLRFAEESTFCIVKLEKRKATINIQKYENL
jgi:hypothetical protein